MGTDEQQTTDIAGLDEAQTAEAAAEQPAKKASLGDKIKKLPPLIKRFWKEPLKKDRYLNLKEVLSLGGAAMGVSTIVCIVSSLLTASQISEVYGIDVVHGPYICLAASLLGLIIQPFFSKLLQNTHTRFGRYKPYIFLMAPIFAGLAVALPISRSARTLGRPSVFW